MTDDPKFCGFCGDIEEAVQEAQAAEIEMNEKDNIEIKGAPSPCLCLAVVARVVKALHL